VVTADAAASAGRTLDDIFAAMSACAELHPDPGMGGGEEDEDEDGGYGFGFRGAYEDEEETEDGASVRGGFRVGVMGGGPLAMSLSSSSGSNSGHCLRTGATARLEGPGMELGDNAPDNDAVRAFLPAPPAAAAAAAAVLPQAFRDGGWIGDAAVLAQMGLPAAAAEDADEVEAALAAHPAGGGLAALQAALGASTAALAPEDGVVMEDSLPS